MLRLLHQARLMSASAAAAAGQKAGPIATSIQLKLQVGSGAVAKGDGGEMCHQQSQDNSLRGPTECGPHSAGSPDCLLRCAPHSCVQEAFQPASLSVENESHKHAGHSGNPGGGPDAETHFK